MMSQRRRRRRKKAEKKRKAQLGEAGTSKNGQSANKEAPQPEKTHFFRTRSTAKIFWKVVVAAISLLGAWQIVKPIIHIEPYLQLDPSNPFSERFRISNDGFFAIHDVTFDCILDRATFLKDGLPEGELSAFHLAGINSYRKIIEAADSTTTDCPLNTFIGLPGTKYNSANIQLNVGFNLAYYPWRKKRSAAFVGQLDSEGNVRWVY
jgi:hypothetical protein